MKYVSNTLNNLKGRYLGTIVIVKFVSEDILNLLESTLICDLQYQFYRQTRMNQFCCLALIHSDRR